MGNFRRDGVDVASVHSKNKGPLVILHDKNVWICDTGASNHTTWCNKGATNFHETQMISLGPTKEVIGTTVMINIPGRFV